MNMLDRPANVTFHVVPPADWDDFVPACEPSHFEQTSRWASVEAGDGWSARYISERVAGRIDAGAMVLIRRQRPFGSVGYVFRGPLFRRDPIDPAKARGHMAAALKELARRERLVLIVVVPPFGGEETASGFLDRGFLRHPPSFPPRGLPTGAATIDLRPGIGEVERGFRRSLKQEINRAAKKGLSVELGSAKDLEIFWSRHLELCRRRGVASNIPGLDYVRSVWKEFSRFGGAWMFNAALGGEVLCSLICLGVGKWFYAWRIGSHKDPGKVHPSQAAFARAIRTAAEAGFHYFDFMGIDWDEAVRIERGEHLNTPTSGMTFFKLGFGGTVRKLPATLAWYPNPVLRSLMRSVGNRILSSRKSQRWIGRPRHSGPV